MIGNIVIELAAADPQWGCPPLLIINILLSLYNMTVYEFLYSASSSYIKEAVMSKYKIKEFTNEMGITVDLAKHYEHYGVIQPEVDKYTNYRYYGIEQGEQVIISKQFRNLGFSIKDTADLIKSSNLNSITSILKMKSDEIKNNILLLNLYLEKLEYVTRMSQKFKNSDSSWEIQKSPGIYFLKQTENKTFSQDNITKKRVKNWLNLLPVTFQVLKIHHESINSRSDLLYNWGIGIHEYNADQLNIDISQPVQYIKPQRVLIYYLNFVCGEGMNIKQFEKIIDLSNKLNLKVSGDILCECIIVSNEHNKPQRHFAVYMPVE